LLFIARYSSYKQVYLNKFIDQFPLSNNNFNQTLGLTIPVKCIWYSISVADIFFFVFCFRLLERNTQKTFSTPFCLYNDTNLCVDSIALYVQTASIYESHFSVNFCSAICKFLFRTRQKRRATVYWFRFWPLKVSCRFAGGHLFILHLLS